MKTTTLDVPAMYADHHVTEVRRILLELPGIKEVNASSAFRAVEISFDAAKTKLETIKEALDAAGYLREISMIAETGAAADNRAFPRHSASISAAGPQVSFAQIIPTSGQPVFSCPGMGVVRLEEE